jgi:hypothetical protein
MRETLREHRMQRAGKTRERDFSESIALGAQVQPTLKGEGVFDARLFNQGRTEGTAGGFHEDEDHFDKKLFAERSGGIYRYDSKRIEQAERDMEISRRPVQFESDQPRGWGEEDEERERKRARK